MSDDDYLDRNLEDVVQCFARFQEDDQHISALQPLTEDSTEEEREAFGLLYQQLQLSLERLRELGVCPPVSDVPGCWRISYLMASTGHAINDRVQGMFIHILSNVVTSSTLRRTRTAAAAAAAVAAAAAAARRAAAARARVSRMGTRSTEDTRRSKTTSLRGPTRTRYAGQGRLFERPFLNHPCRWKGLSSFTGRDTMRRSN
jgi:ribosomal protein L12E/L44/L45/RPP1/RPP2